MTFTVNQRVKVSTEHSSLFGMTGIIAVKHDVYGYSVSLDNYEDDLLWFSDKEIEAA